MGNNRISMGQGMIVVRDKCGTAKFVDGYGSFRMFGMFFGCYFVGIMIFARAPWMTSQH